MNPRCEKAYGPGRRGRLVADGGARDLGFEPARGARIAAAGRETSLSLLPILPAHPVHPVLSSLSQIALPMQDLRKVSIDALRRGTEDRGPHAPREVACSRGA